MKIAICISGHLRTFEKTHASLKRNVLDKYDCDVFLSTWDNVGNTLYHAHYPTGFDETDDKIDVGRVKEVYQPTGLAIQNAFDEDVQAIKKPFEGLTTRNGANVQHIVPMYYKMWHCNNLRKEHQKKTGINYDVVVKCRPDVYIHKLDAEKAMEKIQFLPGHCGFNDLIFLGPSDAMSDVFDLFTILNPTLPFNSFENAENIMHTHVTINNIPHELSTAVEYWFVKPTGAYNLRGEKICELDKLTP